MSLSRSLLSLVALLSLSACQPPCDEGDCDPPQVEPAVDLRSGAWSFEVTDARLLGACEGMDPREIVGQELRGDLRLEGSGRASLELEGVVLRGELRGRMLDLVGDVDAAPEPYPGEGGGESEGEDEGEVVVGVEEPPCEDEPHPGGGGGGAGGSAGSSPGGERPDIHLVAQALDARRLEGSLVVSGAAGGGSCTIEAELSGRHLGDEDPARPDPEEDDRPRDDEPSEPHEGTSEEGDDEDGDETDEG